MATSNVIDSRNQIHRTLASVVALLPRGRTLTAAEWWPRHRAILVLLWAHVVAIPIYGFIQQFDVTHAILEGSASPGPRSWRRRTDTAGASGGRRPRVGRGQTRRWASFRVMLPSERALLQDTPSLSIDAPRTTGR